MNNDFIYTCQLCTKGVPLEQLKKHIRICSYLEAIKHDVNSSEYRPYGVK